MKVGSNLRDTKIHVRNGWDQNHVGKDDLGGREDFIERILFAFSISSSIEAILMQFLCLAESSIVGQSLVLASLDVGLI